MKRTAIIQSSYIPWKGYFAIISLADEFILGDDVQYTKQDWRNRNLIRDPRGTRWLTIPVLTRGRSCQPIGKTSIADSRWAARHWAAIRTNYRRAAHFSQVAPLLQHLYERASHEKLLTDVNELFLRAICKLLNINTRITRSSDYEIRGDRTERLVHLCRQACAQEYLTGPRARAYIDEGKFAVDKITVHWMDYTTFPEYRQLYSPPFVHEVSILDLLLNEGIEGASNYMNDAVARCDAVVFNSGCAGKQLDAGSAAG